MTTDNTYRSRKFGLAVASLTVSAVALFTNKIGSGEWVATITLILGIYSAANVVAGNRTNSAKEQ